MRTGLRRLERQIAQKSYDEGDAPDPEEREEDESQDEDEGQDDGSAEMDREAAKGANPEDAFADGTLAPLFRAWQARLKSPGAPWPARFPAQLQPHAHETPGRFAARAAAHYRRAPEAREHFQTVGQEPEWTDWVTGAMKYGSRTGTGRQGETDGAPSAGPPAQRSRRGGRPQGAAIDGGR